MRITSILIDGEEYIDRVYVASTEVTKEASDRMGTARFTVRTLDTHTYRPEPGKVVEIFGVEGNAGEANQLWGQPLWGVPQWGDPETAEKIFGGEVTLIEPKIKRANPLWLDIAVECRDWNGLLDGTIVQTAGSYANKTDQFIIQDLFGDYLTEVDVSGVANTLTLATFDRREESLRSILQRLQEQTGAIAYVDPDKVLHYRLPSASAAPFTLSETADGVASFAWERESFHVTKEWRNPCNKCTVLGEVASGGARVRRVVEDLTSQAAYGIKGDTVIDAQIKSNDEADARGAVEIAKRANPEYGGTCLIRKDGLEVGDYLAIDAAVTYDFSASFSVRRITMRWDSKVHTKYEIEWGAYRPDDARTMAALYRLAKPNGAVQPTTPAPATVGGTAIIPGAVDGATHIAAASIGQAQMANASIGTAQIIDANITNAKILSIDATKITTGDLIVGYTGHVGMIDVRDSGNNTFMWAGKNGSDYGLWTKILWVGGTGPASAKIKAESDGTINVDLEDGDGIRLFSSSNGMEAIVDETGMRVRDSSTTTNRAVVTKTDVFVGNSSGFGSTHAPAYFQANDAGSVVAKMSVEGSQASLTLTSSAAAILLNSLGIYQGSGSPEGVVSALTGSIYFRNNGGANTTLYVKESGSSNTGWIAK